jgi:hypothetical protein
VVPPPSGWRLGWWGKPPVPVGHWGLFKVLHLRCWFGEVWELMVEVEEAVGGRIQEGSTSSLVGKFHKDEQDKRDELRMGCGLYNTRTEPWRSQGTGADPAIGIPRGDFWKSGCGRDAHATLGGGWVGGGTPQFPLVTGGSSRCCTFGAGLGKLGKMVEVEEAVGG